MNASFPIMPLIVLVLFILPVKISPNRLLKLAFFLWVVGGLFLTTTGIFALMHPSVTMEPMMLTVAGAVALVIGFGKGKMVLSKTSQRNIDRILEMSEPAKPIHVYSLRSWIIITVMVLISLSLTWFDAPWEWRGLVRLAVGFALIMSSMAYLKVPAAKTPSASV